MCGLLLNQLNYIAHSIRGVVANQKVYMVFIGFHCYNAVPFGITDIIYLLFNIVSDRAIKYLFAVLSDENYVHF